MPLDAKGKLVGGSYCVQMSPGCALGIPSHINEHSGCSPRASEGAPGEVTL